MKKVLSFLSEPFNTDELKAKLEQTRDALNAKALMQKQLAADLAVVELEALSVQTKSDYLVNLTGQTLEMFAPAPIAETEAEYARMKDKYYDPLRNFYLYGGAGGAVIWGLGAAVLPGTIKVIGALANSKKIASLAKSTKLLKLAKLGKATVYLAVVVAILEVAMRLVTAKEINDHLRKEQGKIETQNAEADLVLARYEVAIQQGRKLIATYLEEADVEDLEAYEEKLLDAIDEMAEQVSYAKMARNMLRMGMDAETTKNTIGFIELGVVRAVEQRLNAEIMLLAGETSQSIGSKLDMTRYQIDLVALVLKVRADAALGLDEPILMERHGVSEPVADLQIDLVEHGLTQVWDDLVDGGDPKAIAQTLLVEPETVQRLQSEIAARTAMLNGQSPSDAGADHPDLEPERIEEIADELPLIREDIADSPLPRKKLAIDWRVALA